MMSRKAWCGCVWAQVVLGTSSNAPFPVSHEAGFRAVVDIRESEAPFYCPPVQPSSRTCVMEYRVGKHGLYFEETFVPQAIRVLLALDDGYDGDSARHGPLGKMQALLAALEATRLLFCIGRFVSCYDTPALMNRLTAAVCQIVTSHQIDLVSLGGLEEPMCEAMIQRGDMLAVLRSFSVPLQTLVRHILPAAAPSSLGNAGSRFNFETFFETRHALLTDTSERKRQLPRAFGLTYPAEFSFGICGKVRRNESRFDTLDTFDIDEALRRIAVVAPLSHFVVNFGAADGECGVGDDWNADPANCLAIDGDAAVLIEGNAHQFPKLRNRFGNRTNISLVLEYVSLHDVQSLLSEQLSRLPAGAAYPDLLKMDIDHADCLFLEEAVQVVRPKLIQFEIEPLLPPPLDYAQLYQPELLSVGILERQKPTLGRRGCSEERDASSSVGREMVGCSLSAFLSRLPGYVLVAVGPMDALVVRSDLHKALDIGAPIDAMDAWLRGAFCHPSHGKEGGHFAWGFDFRVLVEPTISAEDRLKLLSDLLEHHGASSYHLKL